MMKRRSRVLGMCSRVGLLIAIGTVGPLACSSGGGHGSHPDDNATEVQTGSVRLQLTARGASWPLYRLRNAFFQTESLDVDEIPSPPEGLPAPGGPPIFFDDGAAAGSSGR